MIGLLVRNLFILVVPAIIAAGCASLTGPGKMSQQNREQLQLAEAKLAEANAELDGVNAMSSEFYAQLGTVMDQVKSFCDRPGWLELEQVLIEFPALREQDTGIEITPEMEQRLVEWGRRWNADWEETLIGYHELVDKCTIVEARKLALRERLLSIQGKFIAAALLELYAGREAQGNEIYAVAEVLDKTGAELLSYPLDDLGLYRFR